MRIFFKYASVLNLASIADQVVGLALASGDLNNFDSDRGFGHIFKWRTLNDAFHEAKVTRKPIFLVIHRPWCPACKKLKVNFEKSIKLLDLSKHFIMVNVENTADMVNNSGKFYPDGKYVPRILFFTPDGELIQDAYNRSPKADPEFRYFYSSPAPIIETMLYILKHYVRSGSFQPIQYDGELKRSEIIDDKSDMDKPTVLD